MISPILALIVTAGSSLATIFVTAPVASSSCTAGTPCAIAWADDGNAPLLKTIGASSVGLWVGSVTQQIELQNFNPSLDVSTTGSLSVTIDPTVGANSDQYFIRFVSNDYKENAAAYSSFSAKFALSGMTGTFNSTIQAQIDAGSTTTVGLGASTSAAATSSASKAASSLAIKEAAITGASSAVSVAKASASAAASTSGALPRFATSVLAGGAVVAVAAYVF